MPSEAEPPDVTMPDAWARYEHHLFSRDITPQQLLDRHLARTGARKAAREDPYGASTGEAPSTAITGTTTAYDYIQLADGTFQVFGVGTDHNVWTKWRNPAGGYSSWVSLGGPVHSNGYSFYLQTYAIDNNAGGIDWVVQIVDPTYTTTCRVRSSKANSWSSIWSPSLLPPRLINGLRVAYSRQRGPSRTAPGVRVAARPGHRARHLRRGDTERAAVPARPDTSGYHDHAVGRTTVIHLLKDDVRLKTIPSRLTPTHLVPVRSRRGRGQTAAAAGQPWHGPSPVYLLATVAGAGRRGGGDGPDFATDRDSDPTSGRPLRPTQLHAGRPRSGRRPGSPT